MKFPKGFLFGSATSAHQIEGGNYNSDWYSWEKFSGKKGVSETSKIACDSWHKWQEDIDLLEQSGQNAYRFSIEWAKIEPEEGVFNKEAIDHYRKILETLRKRQIQPLVTLFHFSLPLWLANKGGLTNLKSSYYFQRFATKIAEELGSLIDFCTILNEPNVYTLKGYIQGDWCPGEQSKYKAFIVFCNLIFCQNRAAKAIKKILPSAQVGLAMNIAVYEPANDTFSNRLRVWATKMIAHRLFLHTVMKKCDFLGINHYMKFRIEPSGRAVMLGEEKNDFGWGICPESLYEVIRENAGWKKPIYITEHGIADASDSKRAQFLKDALSAIGEAIKENIPVKGYFYWSLLDNFEWDQAYKMKFGLFTIDRAPRDSANVYKKLIEKYQEK
ncbi:MAG: glycoside hydrolase family 1 protein [bacterium]